MNTFTEIHSLNINAFSDIFINPVKDAEFVKYVSIQIATESSKQGKLKYF